MLEDGISLWVVWRSDITLRVLISDKCSNPGNQCRPRTIVPGLDQDILFQTEPLATYFAIRSELKPTPRGSSTLSSHISLSQSQASSSSVRTSSSQTIASGSSRRSNGIVSIDTDSDVKVINMIKNVDELQSEQSEFGEFRLDQSFPILVMVWLKVRNTTWLGAKVDFWLENIG